MSTGKMMAAWWMAVTLITITITACVVSKNHDLRSSRSVGYRVKCWSGGTVILDTPANDVHIIDGGLSFDTLEGHTRAIGSCIAYPIP